jgi:putative spermidine/putrescine transport system ATP-binding protein
MTVLANVSYALRVRRIPKAEIDRRARRALELVQLRGFENRAIRELSGGQAQRVALARAIVFEPPVLLMDEPLSALDRKLRETMQIEIRRIHERVGATTIYVTHDQREALSLSDRVVVFNAGKIEQIGTPEDVYDRPQTPFVADFVGDSHFLPVTMVGGAAQINGRELKLGEVALLAPRQFLVLRPEKLELGTPESVAEYNRFDGEVLRRVFLGDAVVLSIGVADLPPITVKLGTSHRAAVATPVVGSTISLWLHRKDTILIPAVTS